MKQTSTKVAETSKKNHSAKNQFFSHIIDELSKTIVGMEDITNQILIAFLTKGHVLLEGLPGLAKTMLIKTFAELSGLEFKRIQFTPDLLPGDILGTQIFDQRTSAFITRKGPLFSNIVLADEINRAPSKVQSALLEAMQEKQITIAEKTYHLKPPYLVLATQNPIEQEGTYPLPEAQIDRFMLKVTVTYPSKDEEAKIIKYHMNTPKINFAPILSAAKIKKCQEQVENIYIDDRLIRYIVELVSASRNPEQYGMKKNLINFGASPRASIDLARAAKATAFLNNEKYVKTDDIKQVVHPVLRHRILTSYEADAENITPDMLIDDLLSRVKVP
ncbi:hypothetical protein COTS27_00433 [Spirochaetota bacterium]|nr:hypothetical protein COTS27_00433 [Spirochaetota bacterium]